MLAAHHERSFVAAFFKVSLDHLLDNLASEKDIILLEQSLEKVLNFGSKNTNSVYGSKDSAAIIEVSSESEKREISIDLLTGKALRKRDQCFCNFSTTKIELAKRRQNFFELQPTFILVRKTKDRHLYFRQRKVSLNET